MSSSAPTSAPTGSNRDVAGYFQALSTGYARQTGDSTYNLVYSFLSKLPVSELASPVTIHDNACGVGTATTAILALTAKRSPPHRIEATDSSEPMISQLQARVAEDSRFADVVYAAVEDSHKLPFPNDTINLSITNISVTNFTDPPACLREIYRTLRPGGRAVVSIWKRFTPAELIHQAQHAIKGSDVQLMKVPKSEYFQDGYLRDRMIEAGFDRDHVQQTVETTVIRGEALEGLREFMKGPLTTSARAGWTDNESARWSATIDAVVAEETAKHDGGILMEAWFVTACK